MKQKPKFNRYVKHTSIKNGKHNTEDIIFKTGK